MFGKARGEVHESLILFTEGNSFSVLDKETCRESQLMIEVLLPLEEPHHISALPSANVSVMGAASLWLLFKYSVV